jgi:hypothetical protein
MNAAFIWCCQQVCVVCAGCIRLKRFRTATPSTPHSTHGILVELEGSSLRNKRDLDDGDIVDLRGNVVHAVGGRGGQHGVLGRDTEDPVQHVNDLVGADAEEDPVLIGDTAERGDSALELVVGRRRVPVERGTLLLGHEREGRSARRRRISRVKWSQGGAVRVLISVKEHTGRVVVARTAVRRQRENVGADQGLQVEVGRGGGAFDLETEDGHGGECGTGGKWIEVKRTPKTMAEETETKRDEERQELRGRVLINFLWLLKVEVRSTRKLQSEPLELKKRVPRGLQT